MASEQHGETRATRVADEGVDAALRRDPLAEVEGRPGALLPGPVHGRRARGDGAPLGGGSPRGRGGALRGDLGADGSVDDDRDAGVALAAPRRRQLLARARSAKAGEVRLTVAVPVKGRLRDPSVRLLEDAGLEPEQPGERALAFPCRNAPVDVLLVRAADIPEYVQDGVVDCGITGQDLVAERAARVEELLPLGFGSCRLDVAVPEESPYERIEDLAGASVATVYPRLTRARMPVEVELVDVTGSVEVAPRLGLADGIVDLVSSGNTLRTNGLRSLGTLLESQAVLIGAPGADAGPLVSMMRAVVEARSHRYLMLDAPGMVAVHALVPAKDVWQLLPRLEAVGAFSILVVPVERMLR